MGKRVSTRGIILDGDSVYAMFRRRIKDGGEIKEYYVMPGGGLEGNETLEENLIRELKEEFSVDVRVKTFLGITEGENFIDNFFSCEIVSGTPKLGGEELERSCESNYYEIKRIKIKDLNNFDVLSKDIILKAYHMEH